MGSLTVPQERVIIGATLGVAIVLGAWLHARRRRRSEPKRKWPHGVEVRPSLIPNGGDGLFASCDFEADDVLGEYFGRVLSLLEATKLEDRDYLMGGFG